MDLRISIFASATLALAAALSAADAAGDVKVRRVSLTANAPETALPKGVKNVAVLPPDLKGESDVDVKMALPRCRALLETELIRRAPQYAYVDREAQVKAAMENPDAKPAPIDALITVCFTALAFYPDGLLRADAEVRIIMTQTGKEISLLTYLKAVPTDQKQAMGAEAIRMQAIDGVFKGLADVVAGKLEVKTRTEEAILIVAGPLTRAAVEAAAKGDLETAEAKFAEAAASDDERNCGHYGLYVLRRLKGDKAGAETSLAKAGQ